MVYVYNIDKNRLMIDGEVEIIYDIMLYRINLVVI